MQFWTVALISCLLVGNGDAAAVISESTLSIRILHNNDMHSRFEEISKESGRCSEVESTAGRCYGGFARVVQVVRDARANATSSEPVFFLNAGDTFQGSRLFSHYHASVVARFLNILRPDVASLGNHEFDDSPSGLADFLKNASFPVIAANLDWSEEPELSSLQKSVVLKADNGLIIGVVGYLTPETQQLARTGRVRFFDEVATVREEAARLKSEHGCQLIIALGHSGFEMDKQIAREVEQVHLVIGGHTNTFLWPEGETQPDREIPEGFYPEEVVQPGTGRKVYVVQAYAYTKYLGDLNLEFDVKRNEISSLTGRPKLLDSTVPKAQDVEDELRSRWVAGLGTQGSIEIGRTRVLLDGDEKSCRLYECNFGNLLTDAMVHENALKYVQNPEKDAWTDCAIAVNQAGNIRASISVANDERVTMNDVLTSFPFETKMTKVVLKGAQLWSMLEWSVHDRIDFNRTVHGGGFLQFSGIQVSYDLSKPRLSRVVSAKVRCSRCLVPRYEDLDLEATYPVLVNDFMFDGGDGYDMLKNLGCQDMNVTMADLISRYINQTSPVHPEVEGRIQFIQNDDAILPCNLTTNSAHLQQVSFIGLLILIILQSLTFMHFS